MRRALIQVRLVNVKAILLASFGEIVKPAYNTCKKELSPFTDLCAFIKAAACRAC
ncbi:hypothetical protein IMZ48_11650 [Candidatus Bathyarchaeota archaeon]|nr:hypothetical protein [Candidatus Bathyarchaeota archaeon]